MGKLRKANPGWGSSRAVYWAYAPRGLLRVDSRPQNPGPVGTYRGLQSWRTSPEAGGHFGVTAARDAVYVVSAHVEK